VGSQLAANKLQKLGRTSAAERHLAIVLDPRSQAGLCIPIGLTDLLGPGAAGAALPPFVSPDPLTSVWLIPMVAGWLGLSWTLSSGWAVLG
jgi:hypothetical protein